MKGINHYPVSMIYAAVLFASGSVNTAIAHEAMSGESPTHSHNRFIVDTSRFYFNAGFTQLKLDSGEGSVYLSDLGTATTIAISEGPVEDSSATVEGDTQPTLTIGYRLKSIPSISIETAIAPPLEFGLQTTGTIANESIAPFALGTIPTGIPALGPEVGNAQALPALVTAVYTFKPIWRFQPYIGLGATYVYTFDHKITNAILTEDEGSDPKLDIAPAYGLLGQLGLNTRLTDNLTLITDFKMSKGIKTNSKVTDISLVSPTLGDVVGPATVGKASFDLELDATVFNVALRYRF